MAKERLFRFKKFAVAHSKSAMKVGVDGVLLGCWTDASGARTILDAGCGCGVIALMMAQRFPDADILALDIDENAVEETRGNIAASPWKERVRVERGDITAEAPEFPVSHIVSNPPYFDSGVEATQSARTLARHQATLSPMWLLTNAPRLLEPDGRLSMIFPAEQLEELLSQAKKCGMIPLRITRVRGHAEAPVKRVLAEFVCASSTSVLPETTLITELTLEISPGVPTEEYRRLGHNFYLRF